MFVCLFGKKTLTYPHPWRWVETRRDSLVLPVCSFLDVTCAFFAHAVQTCKIVCLSELPAHLPRSATRLLKWHFLFTANPDFSVYLSLIRAPLPDFLCCLVIFWCLIYEISCQAEQPWNQNTYLGRGECWIRAAISFISLWKLL